MTDRVPEDRVIVLFGATGDLARRKLLPGMFHLAQAGLMPRGFLILGASRTGIEDEEFREMAREAVEESGRRPVSAGAWEEFAARLRFAAVGEALEPLVEAIGEARRELGEGTRVLHYLSLPPRAAADTVRALGELGLGERAGIVTEREKVFEAMPPLDPAAVVRGQYAGYRDEDGVAEGSDTETFVALRAFVDNWRWEGVPFFLRSGKRMAENRHLLTVAFKQPPRRMFPLDCAEIAESFGHDHLTFELGDPGSISASFLAKAPGPTMHLGEAHMRFSYADTFGGAERALDAYERLIHDVMLGDRTLFTTSEAIERLWEISTPLFEAPPPALAYEPGSWGPAEIGELIAPRRWHLPNQHVE